MLNFDENFLACKVLGQGPKTVDQILKEAIHNNNRQELFTSLGN